MNKNITYNDNLKELPVDQLYNIFYMVGWADKDIANELYDRFNLPFINSTYVVSAWDNDKLVGVVRVLSDKVIRSSIYDLAILPEYQGQGIGKTLIQKCIAKFPNTAWLVETIECRQSFYEKHGFKIADNVILRIPSKWEK